MHFKKSLSRVCLPAWLMRRPSTQDTYLGHRAHGGGIGNTDNEPQGRPPFRPEPISRSNILLSTEAGNQSNGSLGQIHGPRTFQISAAFRLSGGILRCSNLSPSKSTSARNWSCSTVGCNATYTCHRPGTMAAEQPGTRPYQPCGCPGPPSNPCWRTLLAHWAPTRGA